MFLRLARLVRVRTRIDLGGPPRRASTHILRSVQSVLALCTYPKISRQRFKEPRETHDGKQKAPEHTRRPVSSVRDPLLLHQTNPPRAIHQARVTFAPAVRSIHQDG